MSLCDVKGRHFGCDGTDDVIIRDVIKLWYHKWSDWGHMEFFWKCLPGIVIVPSFTPNGSLTRIFSWDEFNRPHPGMKEFLRWLSTNGVGYLVPLKYNFRQNIWFHMITSPLCVTKQSYFLLHREWSIKDQYFNHWNYKKRVTKNAYLAKTTCAR